MTTDLIGIHPKGATFPKIREAIKHRKETEEKWRERDMDKRVAGVEFDEDRDYEVSSEYFGPQASPFGAGAGHSDYQVAPPIRDPTATAEEHPRDAQGNPLPVVTEPLPTLGEQLAKKDAYGDPLKENILEFMDPSAITSWNDATRAFMQWKKTWPKGRGAANPFNNAGINAMWEAVGAIPGFGKAKKAEIFTPKAKLQNAWYPVEKVVRGGQGVSDIKQDQIDNGNWNPFNYMGPFVEDSQESHWTSQ